MLSKKAYSKCHSAGQETGRNPSGKVKLLGFDDATGDFYESFMSHLSCVKALDVSKKNLSFCVANPLKAPPLKRK